MSNKCTVGAGSCKKWHPKIFDYIMRSVKVDGKPRRIKIAEMCRELNVSRPTLYTHMPFINETLDRLGNERQRTDGQASSSELTIQLEKVKQDLASAHHTIHILKTDILVIMQTLTLRDLPLSALVQAELEKLSGDTTVCPCCRQRVELAISNVVTLHSARPDGH